MPDQTHGGSGDNIAGDKVLGDKVLGDKIIHNHTKEEKPKGIGLDAPVIEINKLPQTSSQLFGREDELALLNQCWHDNTHVLVFKAMGGTGKHCGHLRCS